MRLLPHACYRGGVDHPLAGGPWPIRPARSALLTCRRAIIGSADFGSSAVPGALRGLLTKMIAEIFGPLLCPLPRHAKLPLFYASFVAGDVPEFPKLRAGLGVQNGLQRFFDGLPGPLRPGLRLAHQDLVGHPLDASIFAHGVLSSSMRKPSPRVSITLLSFTGPTDRGPRRRCLLRRASNPHSSRKFRTASVLV